MTINQLGVGWEGKRLCFQQKFSFEGKKMSKSERASSSSLKSCRQKRIVLNPCPGSAYLTCAFRPLHSLT